MKKIAMFIAVVAMAVTASAEPREVITAQKATDNVYVGVNAGASTSLKGDRAFDVFAPNFGIRVGKNFTTVFGLALEADAYFNAHKSDCDYQVTKTFVNGIDANLLGTANLMNLFAGYKGQPRDFEVIALGGFGWGKTYGLDNNQNFFNTKVAVDFAYNFGADKQWQAYVEPSLVYATQSGSQYFKYNVNDAIFSLKAGVNYKFGTSNGTHNFAKEQLRDQAEIDALNAKINAARAEADAAKAQAAAKDAQIAQLKKALADCEAKPVQQVIEKKGGNLQPTVVFNVGKSVVEKSQLANIDMIAKYMKGNKDAKVKISGYASPEGDPQKNQILSENRANAVKDVLVKKYKISADRLEAVGLGATDKLFDEVEFNRVVVFDDLNK